MTDLSDIGAPGRFGLFRPRWLWIAMILLLALIGFNAMVTVPALLARQDEHGVTLLVYRRWLVDPTTTVIDMWNIDGNQSMTDVDRNVFKIAEALKDRSAGNIELAYHGSSRLLLDGTKFAAIGEEWRTQSPLYLIGAFPRPPSGRMASRCSETGREASSASSCGNSMITIISTGNGIWQA